ncbi:phage baseplate assembly protein V [Nevskia sp.]|uniref:phage baseplate assembly protein V n=1 Tax=Nevskia sp. TaxID=1929292 RepID=UPI0025DCD156|nr:phage baseplate assembly protein V [Nevskia sp.]
MNLGELIDASSSRHSRIDGVVIGLVTNNQDPEGLARVRLKFPWLNDADESAWARVVSFMAGPDRGALFLPEVGDEVLVAFEHGDPRFPYVLGALWNGKDSPPEANSSGGNDIRVIRSRSGHVIRLNDKAGAETIEIIDKSGSNCIVIDSAANTLTISAPQGKIRLEANQIEIEATTTAVLKGATVNIN